MGTLRETTHGGTCISVSLVCPTKTSEMRAKWRKKRMRRLKRKRRKMRASPSRLITSNFRRIQDLKLVAARTTPTVPANLSHFNEVRVDFKTNILALAIVLE